MEFAKFFVESRYQNITPTEVALSKYPPANISETLTWFEAWNLPRYFCSMDWWIGVAAPQDSFRWAMDLFCFQCLWCSING